MNCPVDGTTLQMSERQGVEIDYCPQCRGVWLDRGELDKIIDRTESERADAYSYRRHDDDDDYDDRDRFGQKRKKRGFLSELFERDD
jgi:Zn-finger nucleic acid-binding protein